MNTPKDNLNNFVFGADNSTEFDTDVPASFVINTNDWYLIGQIVKRGVEMAAEHKVTVDFMTMQMDIAITHANGTPLKLLQWLMSDNSDFRHDFCGIGNTINRKTNKLMYGFVPIFADKGN
jgi:hypothetical protein